MIGDVIILHLRSPEALETLRAHGNDLAAVLVELPQSRRPDLVPTSFLKNYVILLTQAGTALIFDEVVSGFRTHPGGAQALFGVHADIIAYGKAMGGGLPVAAIAGTAKFLDAIDGGMWSYGDESYPTSI